MCFNAAKTWQLGWHDSNKVVVDPRNDPTTVNLVGIANFIQSSDRGEDRIALKADGPDGSTNYEFFEIKSTGDSKPCLDSKNGSTANGNLVWLYPCN
jgi:hypothetical protein